MSSLFLIAIGFAGLLIGGEILVRGAVQLAQAANLSPLVIGVTLVGFGTSMPELGTSLQAALDGANGIAIGNVVGSNIANILLILGLAALIRPFPGGIVPARRDSLALAGATLLCSVFVLYGSLSRGAGVALMIGLIWYLVQTLRTGQDTTNPDPATTSASPHHTLVSTLMFIGGLALTILGARFLVQGAINLAQGVGVSDTLIGLTIVAIGTSLPELVTSVVAAYRGRADIAVGNIIGSNIFNILGILGITAVVHPLDIPTQIARLDNWVMVAATIAFLFILTRSGQLSRLGGAALGMAYAGYILTLLTLT